MSFLLFAIASLFVVAGVIYLAQLSLIATSVALCLALLAGGAKLMQAVWNTPIWE